MEEEYLVEDGQVERLHAMLAGALLRTRPDAFGSPVTVAEIYQDLVPYRNVRSVLGFHMNADYEHTLLRMLAGESGLARLEPESARDELKAELDTPNPNVGLFRKFAACDVWVEPSDIEIAVPEPARRPAETAVRSVPAAPPPPPPVPAAASPEPEPELEAEPLELIDATGSEMWAEPQASTEWEGAETELLLEEEVEEVVELEVEAITPDTPNETLPPPAVETTQRAAVMFESNPSHSTFAERKAAGACAFCQSALPGGRVVRYCPHCGADQSLKPCVSCREPLDPAWTFCIGCGSRQS